MTPRRWAHVLVIGTLTAAILSVTGLARDVPFVAPAYQDLARLLVVLVLGFLTVWASVATTPARGCDVHRHRHRAYCFTHHVEWSGSGPCPERTDLFN